VLLVSAAVRASAVNARPDRGAGIQTTGHSAQVAKELVFVANAGSGPVTAYPARSSGHVAAVDSIPNPGLNNTVWDPWGVAFDPAGDLFVQTFISDATTFVFPWGHTTPARIFRVDGPDSRSIAVDATGYEYVAHGEGPAMISVAAPGAAGMPSQSYSVPAVRTISTAENEFAPWPSSLAVDPAGQIVVAAMSSLGNAVEVFAGGAGGSNTPLRSLSGSATGLGTCAGFDTCDHLAVATSALTGDLYVAVTTSSGAAIEEFSGTANGDVAPLRSISGKRTGLNGMVVTGLAVSSVNGNIYAMVKPAQFSGPGLVEVFLRGAHGNAHPRRSFTDATDGFVNAAGIAVVRPPSSPR
jgi:hypothetical protein